MRFEIFSVTAPLSPAAGGAIRLASVVQKMEMIARLGLEEAEKRKRRAMSEGGQEGRKEERQNSQGKQALGPPRDRARASYLPSSPTPQTRTLRSKS